MPKSPSHSPPPPGRDRPAALRLDTPVQYIRGIGPRKAARLAEAAGIATVEDFLSLVPFRYEDRSRCCPIADAPPGQPVTLTGAIVSAHRRFTRRRGFSIFEALVDDGTAALKVLWYNQPYLARYMTEGRRLFLYGTVGTDRYGRGFQMENPQWELLDGEGEQAPLHAGRIVPVYQRVKELSSKQLRAAMRFALDHLAEPVPDPLPATLVTERRLPDRDTALRHIHFPPEGEAIASCNSARSAAHRRLIYEEFFLFQLLIHQRRLRVRKERKPFTIEVNDDIREKVRRVLPFKLTDDQKRALKQIVDDLRRDTPMNRLLQGDVGAGKTIVALLSMLVVVENGCQAALMAPTEVLAEQHGNVIQRTLAGTPYVVRLLTQAVKGRERKAICNDLLAGRIHVLIGTHALLSEGVEFRKLAYCVIDEQHRFGVAQRARLSGKGDAPDVLVMTATPIPRSLALTVYGDLDVSVIRQLPPGRRPIDTRVIEERDRPQVIDLLRREIAGGHQAYLVYPLVEESAKMDLKAATEAVARWQGIFPEWEVGLVHGRQKKEEREAVMTRFYAGELKLLVCTTVIEVGVDVPNATVMVIEHADRFGLAQLHQLRGRVGRGSAESVCLLLRPGKVTPEAEERLGEMAATEDGFRIAEKDLELRGPGEVLGVRQSGLPSFRVGHLLRDFAIMEEARADAAALLEGGRPLPKPLTAELYRRYRNAAHLLSAG